MQRSITDLDQIASQCRTVFDPLRCINENSDLFLLGDAQRAEVTIPVVGSVRVGVPSLALINTPEFQRLRLLKQLSFCDWHFPGAVHTRFEHALGAYEVACEAVHQLAHQVHFRRNFNATDVRAFLLAALVHDVGHYPFAHPVEHYASGRFDADLGTDAKRISKHETYTDDLLSVDGPFRALAIENWGSDAVDRARQILRGNGQLLSSLIDGPLDIDKMDYLLRDAHHAGLSFARYNDPRNLCSVLEADINGGEVYGKLEDLATIEGFVLLQDQLYGALYWHPMVRALHAMFHAVIAHIVAKNLEKLKYLVEGLRKAHSEFQAIGDVIIPAITKSEYIKKEQTRGRLIAIAESMRSPDYRKVYRLLATFRHDDQEHRITLTNVFRTVMLSSSQTGSANQIAWHAATKLRQSYLTAVQQHVESATDVDVLIDIPFGKGAKRFASVLNSKGEPVRLDKATHLKQSAFEQPTVHWSPIRVFLAPEHYDKIHRNLESIRLRAEEEFFQKEGPRIDAQSTF